MAVGILAGMSIVEGSAFIAAPLGGMTLAQLGADVIRYDPIGGGLDYGRWPLAPNGASLFWAGMNKGKRSIRLDLRSPRRAGDHRRADHPPPAPIMASSSPICRPKARCPTRHCGSSAAIW